MANHFLIAFAIGYTLFALFGGYNVDGLLKYFTLPKKYTLRLPLIAPVGGKINPMGDACTESVDFLMSKVNSQSAILPDYNLVIDIIDDECTDSLGLRRVLAELQDWKTSKDMSTVANTPGKIQVPTNPLTFTTDTAQTAYTPPYIVGAICSAVCKVTGKLPQHFNLINTANACIDPALDDRRRYPNFYRLYRSVRETSVARVSLATTMGWNKIAILCDTTQYTYQDSVFFMKTLAQSHIEVMAEEYFQDDPTEAILRLKAVDARIIFAVCYINVCPAIACAAYRLGYYGANVVWIFNSETDLISRVLNRPKGCEPWMTDKFIEGNFFMGIDLTASTFNGHRSEIGISALEITNYIREQSPNALLTGAVEWRLLCYELAHNAAYITDKVEKRLKANGETLMTVISDPSRVNELREMFRAAIFALDIQASWGRSTRQLNSTVLQFAYSSPVMMVQQVQQLTRKAILVQRTIGLYEPLGINDFIWGTSNRKAPRSEPIIINSTLQVSRLAVSVVRSISSALIFVCICGFVVLVHFRNRMGYEDSFTQMNLIILTGSCLALVAGVIYPADDDDLVAFEQFCRTAPILVAASLILSVGGLVMKLWTAYIFRVEGRISQLRRVQRNSLILFSIWCLINGAIIMAFYLAPGGTPTAVTIVKEGGNNFLAEKKVTYRWQMCASGDFTLGWVVIGLQALCAISGIIVVFITKYSLNVVYISDMVETRTCLYIVFPLAVALLLAMIIVSTYSTHFAILSVYAILQSVITISFLFLWKLKQTQLGPVSGAATMATVDGPTAQNTSFYRPSSLATRQHTFGQRMASVKPSHAQQMSHT